MKASKSLIQRTSSSLVPLAVAGLLAGLSACSDKPAETKTEPKPAVESSKPAAPAAHAPSGAASSGAASSGAASAEKHACSGKNACKGQGGCKTSDNGCKGKNSCKGKGGCESK
jgi:hypothetical protein